MTPYAYAALPQTGMAGAGAIAGLNPYQQAANSLQEARLQ